MVECEYCGDAFDTEEARLEHLGEQHADELGPIDERRVAAATKADEAGLPIGGLVGGAAVLVIAVVAIWFLFLSGSGNGGEGTGIESQPLPESGDDEWISQVESFEDNGRQHVSGDVDYERVPPLSGPHWGEWEDAGFYEETPRLERLVHTLEHGAVVIYYDADTLSPEAEASLKAWTASQDGPWTSILAVPNPNENPKGQFVLTAWTHRLVIDDYDAEAVRAFAAEYLGRGPENPVR